MKSLGLQSEIVVVHAIEQAAPGVMTISEIEETQENQWQPRTLTIAPCISLGGKANIAFYLL
jgi:hypothetical protein